MSDHIAQSFNDTNERSRRSMQSVWMSHWTRTSYNVTAETRNHKSNASGNKEIDCVTMLYHPTIGLEASRSVRRLRETETLTLETMNDNTGTSSRNLRNEGFGCQYIPTTSPFKYSGCSSKAKHYQGADEALGPSFGSFAVSKPSHEYFVRSTSHIVPYGFDNRKYEFNKGKADISSFIDRSAIVSYNQLANASLRTLEREHHNILRKSAFSVYGRQIDSNSQSGNSRNAHFSESDTPTSLDAPSMSDGHLSAFGREPFLKMQKLSGMKPLPTQSSALEKTELKKSHTDCYSLEKLPNCVDDAETMRIYTTVDSVEGEPGGCSRFSQTTHSLLITKRTDVNSSKENDFLRDRRVVTVFNGNKSRDFHNLSPPYYGQGEQGVKLQALVSSTDSEGKENVKGVKASKVIVKNESSTETDAMDVDSFKEKNQFSGTY